MATHKMQVYCSRLVFRRRLFCSDGEANDIHHQKSVEIIVKVHEMHAPLYNKVLLISIHEIYKVYKLCTLVFL